MAAVQRHLKKGVVEPTSPRSGALSPALGLVGVRVGLGLRL